MRRSVVVLLPLLLGACAAYSGYGLKPGEDGAENVLHVMGQPAMRWQNPDGSVQFAYPRGPMGYQTYMASFGPDGKLQKIENVLDEKNFSRIQAGMSKEEVHRILGPSFPGWMVHSKARGESIWEWRYCDVWNAPARFDVVFDLGETAVRSTASRTEALMGFCGKGSCWCSH